MQGEFEMSMIGELTLFLGLQINQSTKGIFISQTKYCTELQKKFELENAMEAATRMATSCYLDTDEQGKMIAKPNTEVWSVPYFILQQVNQTLCIVCVCVCVCVCARFQEKPKGITPSCCKEDN